MRKKRNPHVGSSLDDFLKEEGIYEQTRAIAALELEVLEVVGEESKRNGTDSLTSRQIDRIIKASRAQRSKG